MCNDIGRVKGPILRGLAARAPYVHQWFGGNFIGRPELFTISDFGLGLTNQQKSDLVAFLKTL